jgi:hypothetical protein
VASVTLSILLKGGTMSIIGNVSNTKGKVLIIDDEEGVSSVGVEQRGEQDMPAFSRVGGLTY